MRKNTLNKNLTGFILDRIELKRNHFTPKPGQLASYISLHYRDVAFMSIPELARASGVSDATITRFSTALGYSGFPAMKQDLQQNIQTHLTAAERFWITSHIKPSREPKSSFHKAIFQAAQKVRMLIQADE